MGENCRWHTAGEASRSETGQAGVPVRDGDLQPGSITQSDGGTGLDGGVPSPNGDSGRESARW